MRWTDVPQVSGATATGHARELREDPLGLLRRSAAESRADGGGLTRLDAGPGAGACLVLHAPADIEAMLADRDASFFKPKMELWKRVLGENVLTSEGPAWAASRRRSVRVLGAPAVRDAARVVAETADERLRHWAAVGSADRGVDVYEEMRALTLTAALRHLCGTDDGLDLAAFGRNLRTVMERIHSSETGAAPGAERPEGCPASPGGGQETAAEREFDRAARGLRTAVLGLVSRHPYGRDDLIGLLGAAGLTAEQVCDEVLAHLIAGHESTATSLAWSLLLLAEHPEAARCVRAEVTALLGDRRPDHDEAARLPLLRGVFLEALRLYPPAWTVMRATAGRQDLSGVHVPAGAVVLACPYTVQRDPRWFPGPDEFRPERAWATPSTDVPKYAYFPFGGGRRSCPGRHLAEVTAGVVLARVLQGFALEPQGALPEPAVDIILRPPAGTRLRAVPHRAVPPRKELP